MLYYFIKKTTIIFTIVFVSLELFSIFALTINGVVRSESSIRQALRQALDNRISDLYESQKKLIINYGDYEPVGGAWSPVGTKFHSGNKFFINEKGFVSNQLRSKKSELFPQIGGDFVRGLVFGGSSALGIGVESGSETISGFLEKVLNEKSPVLFNKKYIQVLNFGIIAGYSGDVFRKFTNYLIHSRPEFIVWYTGHNDALNATNPEIPFVNWGEASVGQLINFHLGKVSQISGFPRLWYFPFSSALLDNIFKRSENELRVKLISQVKSKTPVPFLISELVEDFTVNRRKSIWATNVEMLADICSAQKISLYVILAPYSHLSEYHIDKNSLGFRIAKIYSLYQKELLMLKEKYRKLEGIQLFDYTKLFHQYEPNDIFIDGHHLTAKGNKIIAETLSNSFF